MCTTYKCNGLKYNKLVDKLWSKLVGVEQKNIKHNSLVELLERKIGENKSKWTDP